MDKSISRTLELLGCSPLEIKLFLSALQLGPSRITQLASAAKIRRSTTYVLTENLASKGLFLKDLKDYGKKIYPVEPASLLELLASKQRSLRKQELDLREKLPEILSAYQKSDVRPKVKIFEGNSGLIQVWKDILSASEEILLWTNQQTENLFFGPENHAKFIAERIKKHLSIRVLAVNNASGKSLLSSDISSLRQTRLLPTSTSFSAETYIYGRKVAFLDYDKDIIGVVIESQPISSTQRSTFELVWKILG